MVALLTVLSPCFSRPGNYKALLVEPQQAPFEAMRKHYTGRADLLFANVAVATQDGEVVLYTSPDGATPFASILPGHRGQVAGIAGAVREVRVPGVTARKLLAMHGLAAPSLLMVDTEGFDLEVTRQFLATGLPLPLVIQLESYHLSRNDREALRILLHEKSYTFVDVEQDTVCFHTRLISAQGEH